MKVDRSSRVVSSSSWLLRIGVLVAALAMPAVAWMSQRGAFGPDNGTISDRYPTLLVAAGYAFSIWGLIFLGDVAFGLWQLRRAPVADRDHDDVARARPLALVGFAATALWMPVFSQQIFWLALVIIWVALACVVGSALMVSGAIPPPSGPAPSRGPRVGRSSAPPPALERADTLAAWLPLSLHAGWLSLAAYLNTAQVVVAYRLAPVDEMWPWSLPLFAMAAALLLAVNHLMRGNAVYVAAVVWGLVGVHVAQRSSELPGALAASWTAVAIAIVLVAQTVWLRVGRHGRRRAHA